MTRPALGSSVITPEGDTGEVISVTGVRVKVRIGSKHQYWDMRSLVAKYGGSNDATHSRTIKAV